MKKMLEIEMCENCTHMVGNGAYEILECELKDYEMIEDEYSIPSWCPLPDAVSGWRDIADAPLGEKVLLLFSNGHIEDAEFFDDGDGKYYILYDGESLNVQPTHFLPLTPPPVGK